MPWLLTASLLLAAARTVPTPYPDHREHVWLADEPIRMLKPANVESWQVLDINGEVVAAGRDSVLNLGQLPVGWYEAVGVDGANTRVWRTGLAVITRLAVPTPLDSPIGLDVATSWFYSGADLQTVASQCALAGVNWVRDRLTWGELETAPGVWAANTRFDAPAKAMADAGLQNLQVFHSTPRWAAQRGHNRMGSDLRDVHRLMQTASQRWAGQTVAWESWNEADIEGFGGMTGSEMAAWQKASYWGLKAGGTDAIVGHNCLALWRTDIAVDLAQNESFAYADTFNFHHYSGTDAYADYYEKMGTAAGGRDLWVTEAGTRLLWAGDPAEKELDAATLIEQGRFVTQCLAASLAEGSRATFFFVMMNYAEGPVQFGITRADRSPRPGYVALAAAGRLLASARQLGRTDPAQRGDLRLHAFRARPDGRPATVLVAWSAGEEPAALPDWIVPEAAYNHFGRSIDVPTTVGADPVYIVCGPNLRVPLPGPNLSRPRRVEPSPLVLQPMPPLEGLSLDRSATRLNPGETQDLTVWTYNFGQLPISTTVRASADRGLVVHPRTQHVDIAPGERVALEYTVSMAESPTGAGRQVVRFEAPTGGSRSVAALGYLVPLTALEPTARRPVPGADDSREWRVMNSAGEMTISAAEGGGVEIAARLESGDRWVYPFLPTTPERRPGNFDAIAFTIIPLEGQSIFRFIADKDNGANYLVTADFAPPLEMGRAYPMVARFDDLYWGAFSPADPDGRFDPARMVLFKVGLNTDDAVVRYIIRDVAYVHLGR